MQYLHPQVEDAISRMVHHDHPLLTEMEERAKAEGFPIIGPVVGTLLYQYARILRARNIFELGSGFGYSTVWLARAVADNGGGRVYHTVWDEALSRDARRYLTRAGLAHLVHFEVTESTAALRRSHSTFDLIFNDIDKAMYPDSLPPIKEKLRNGGVAIFDNVLWGGRIFDPENTDPDTEGVRILTERLRADREFSSCIIPVRDGILVAVRTQGGRS